MNENEQVEKLEAKGRDLFRKFCQEQPWCKVIKESNNRFDHWDMGIMSGNTKAIVEIKYREYPSTAFNSWYLEVKKENELRKIQEKCLGTRIFYVNFFTDDFIAIWDIDKIKYSIETTRAMMATQYKNIDKIDKTVKNLLFIDAVHVSFLKEIFINNEEQVNNEEQEEDFLPF